MTIQSGILIVDDEKEHIPFDEARNIITAGRNTQFYLDVTDAFLDSFTEFKAISVRYQVSPE